MPDQPNPSSELEAFLRKTAEIRQRKTITQRVEAEELRQRQMPTRPQYTNAHQERMTDSSRFQYEEVDAALMDDGDEDAMAIAVEVVDEAPLRLRSRDVRAPEHVHQEHSEHTGHGRVDADRLGNSPVELIKAMFRGPSGLRQAFLIREILDRPKF